MANLSSELSALDGKFKRIKINKGKVTWKDCYKAESEIIADLMTVKYDANIYVGVTPYYTGYNYIHSFAKRVQSGIELTEKQMKQAKRLAPEIRKAALVAKYI